MVDDLAAVVSSDDDLVDESSLADARVMREGEEDDEASRTANTKKPRAVTESVWRAPATRFSSGRRRMRGAAS